MEKMNNIMLQNKTEIPQLGLGTWQQTGPDCTRVVNDALDMGYIHIDTAEAYGNEEEIGKALVGVDRHKLFITSKLWISHYSYDDTIAACDTSLEKLGTDYLDLYLMHWPDSNIDMKETMRALKTLYDEGKVKAVGVSNFTITHLKQYLPYAKEIGLPIVMNQVEFHPLLYQKELLDYCTENGIAVTAYSPLARGEVFKNKTLQDISEKHNVTAAQISLAWLMHHGLVVIPKASSKEHLKSNLDADSITLSDEDIEAINTIDEQRRLVNPEFGEFDEM